MSLTKFEIFRTVVEIGNLTKASETLNLSQSAVSHAISSLESELGFKLLMRGRFGVKLTDNGERILRHVHSLLQVHEHLKQEAAEINKLETGTLRIGSFSSVTTQWLPQIMMRFQQLHPSIELILAEGDYNTIEQWIVNGTVDLGFVSLPTSEALEVIPLRKDGMLCIVSNQHPLHAQKNIGLEQLSKEPFIIQKAGCDKEVRMIFKESGFRLNVKFEVSDVHAIIAMVQSGLGISIIPEMLLPRLPENISALRLEREYYRTIGLATSSLTTTAPAARKFIETAKEWHKFMKLSESL
ncbi:LysR family transcriptional regulator [Paenibacillus marchantiophytorum]|uniref:LysR family transcriptional regulator n=1 Tax=Paenibacillus marchantiophytorum TaxID=1619310 RepID=A0ABQ1EYA0_9BACL|nr:LysR family transcriptional regulator [Paenibacillus marchantiophytorum]GFZ91890.1 LysR family transcriptional regulator [Paenibacillus marchantiophytorum]